MSFCGTLLESAGKDMSLAARGLRNTPAFTVTVVLTLALAIGATASVFTLVRRILLRPLEYSEPNQLVTVTSASPIWFETIRKSARSFRQTGAYAGQESLILTAGSEPEAVGAARVSSNFLHLLGVAPKFGRSFLPEEDQRGGRTVAMISDELWERRFSARSDAIGQTMNLGGTPYTIVGVLPPRFAFPFPGLDVWLTAPQEWPVMGEKSRALSPFLNVFARLRPGVDLTAANAEVDVLRHQYAQDHPAMLDAKPRNKSRVTPLNVSLVRKVRSLLWMLFGAVCFVLLIACSNVAILLLAKTAARSQEMAIRSALGATRARLIRQLLAESVLLSVAGGILGVGLALLCVRLIPGLTAPDLPRSGEVQIDWVVLLFAAAVSLGTGLLFGLMPGLAASVPDLFTVLRATGSASGAGGRRLFSLPAIRAVLVAGQIALCVTLLVGAGLLLKSVVRLYREDLGFNTAHVLTARVSLPAKQYATGEARNRFFEAVVRNLETYAGVRDATTALSLPMTAYPGTPVQDAAKPPALLNERLITKLLVVTPNYFHTLQIPIRRGRDFSERDSPESERVALIDEACARRFWPSYPGGLDPIGQYLLVGGANPKPARIIGIVRNAQQSLGGAAWPETVYVPFAQEPQPSAMLAIRTDGPPEHFANIIRQSVRTVDRNQPVLKVQTMEALIDAEVGQRRLTLLLLEGFAGAAFLLAVIGIYGVVSYSVVERTREIGVRCALGAQRTNIVRMVAGTGLRLALAGIAAGLLSSFAVTRIMKSLLYHVSATDPAVFLLAAIAFLLVALAASLVPAARAATIDPMRALRLE